MAGRTCTSSPRWRWAAWAWPGGPRWSARADGCRRWAWWCAGLAPGQPRLAGAAGLRHAEHRRTAGDHAVAAGARTPPPRVPAVAARAAAAGRPGIAAVPGHHRRFRAADPDPGHRRAVRRRPAGTEAGAQDRAERAGVDRVRRAADRPPPLRLARHEGGALDAGGDAVAVAGVLRQPVRDRTGLRAFAIAACRPRSAPTPTSHGSAGRWPATGQHPTWMP
ncbi:hypothetical protein G6F68_010551 [Rhizopus microsporus]|nr:hypothetical protein G6F68_010551 [Rhizopus microsporus]